MEDSFIKWHLRVIKPDRNRNNYLYEQRGILSTIYA